MRRVGIEVCDLPAYEGFPKLDYYLIEFEEKVVEPQRLLALDFALKDTPSRWWVTHKQSISKRPQCRRLIEVRFWREGEIH